MLAGTGRGYLYLSLPCIREELKGYICGDIEYAFSLQGVERIDNQRREWSDRRAHHLYSIASTSKNGDLRREALLFLGALGRAGNKDAEWAIESIKRRSTEENETTHP
jgi:hypothetical protein